MDPHHAGSAQLHGREIRTYGLDAELHAVDIHGQGRRGNSEWIREFTRRLGAQRDTEYGWARASRGKTAKMPKTERLFAVISNQ